MQLFGSDLFLQDCCRTQFAGIATHVDLIALLREIAPHFDELDVLDEGEFWETEDLARLESFFTGFDTALAEFLQSTPDAQVKVRIAGGRIIDVVG